jgi:hypothetical protein
VKIIVSYNIGYQPSSGGGVLNGFPTIWYAQNHSEWIKAIRENPIDFLEWAYANSVSLKSLVFYFSVYEEVDNDHFFQWEFKVSVKNIREYKEYLGLSTEEFEQTLFIHKRNSKLEQLLNSGD